MISLAITTHNRSGFVAESFINVLENEYIEEIVIVDDCSDIAIYNNLNTLLHRLNHCKVKLWRNTKNIGSFANKIRSIKSCHNDWVLSLDSDNVIDNDYIETLKQLEKNPDTIYCPCKLYNVNRTKVQWDYSEFSSVIIDRNNVRDYVENVNFETSLNTGNNFLHRNTFLNAMKLIDVPVNQISGGDGTYISYLWLLSGGKIKIINELVYGHRIHDGSYYLQHIEDAVKFNSRTYQKIRELNPPASGFVVAKEFREMIKRSYDYNQQIIDGDKNWTLMEELYNKNYLYATINDYGHIPKKIHQIWLGGPIPDKYKRMADTWVAMNPEWEYKLWTDSDVKRMNIPNRKLYDSMTNYGPKSDLLRYHILNEYGGIYADTDFECLRPFDAFTYLDFFTGLAYQSKLELYPGLMGSIPHHPILKLAVQEILKIKDPPRTPQDVLEKISSYFFTRVFLQIVKEYVPGIVAFPTDYFYPFPNSKGHQSRDYRFSIKDCSYTVHHWATSWIKK